MKPTTPDGVLQGIGGASDEDRRTYELFAGHWGAEERSRAALEDPASHPIADAFN
jgi:hypothetical protein